MRGAEGLKRRLLSSSGKLVEKKIRIEKKDKEWKEKVRNCSKIFNQSPKLMNLSRVSNQPKNGFNRVPPKNQKH